MSIDIDTEYEEYKLEAVTESEKGWDIRFAGARGFYVSKEHGVRPMVGQVARFYGRGIGSSVRGLTLDGRVVFYRTPDEQAEHQRQLGEAEERRQRAEWEKNAAKYEADAASLPAEFKDRIARFKRVRPNDFWRHESYELFVCQEAVKIAQALKTPEAVREFHSLPWEEQKARVADVSDGHSGNTFGVAVRLAHRWLSTPELVARDHGALCPLVGCEDYGCFAAYPEAA